MMISDIVTLRELPNAIRDSIEAYVGCVSGAIKKDEYLQEMKMAGFQEVKVMGETSFPVDFILNDPMVKAVVEKSGLPAEKVEEIAGSVVSIKIYGVKPAERS